MRTIDCRRLSCGLFCLGICLCSLTGCQVGRTWFQMDSNSPMPFFGFDLLPRRTVELTPPGEEDASVPVSAAGPSRIQQVSDRFFDTGRELKLPHVSLRGDEESVTFSGPQPVFSR